MEPHEGPSDIPGVMRRFSWRGVWLGLRASSRMGRAERLQRKGDPAGALRVALEALEMLRDPGVYRFAPGPFVETIAGAKLVYELATTLGCPEHALRPVEKALEMVETERRSDTILGRDTDSTDEDVRWLRRTRASLHASLGR